jgi:molybdate transport system substrate-binding protein
MSHMRPPQLKVPILLALVLVGLALTKPLRADDLPVIRVLAAGSLRIAMTEIAAAYSSSGNVRVEASFGPSGVLRERIEKGEPTDLFASADIGNPLTLSRAGKAGPVVVFARNRLCAVARPGLTIAPDTLLATLLDPHIKVGTSTPKADPAGDYTWAMFAKADAVSPGSRAQLEAKALQLVGGPASAAAPVGINIFAWHLREGHADIFLAYCSARADLTKDLPDATVINLPPELATGADYGLTLLPANNGNAASLALFILSQDGQTILSRNGFDAPLLSSEQR